MRTAAMRTTLMRTTFRRFVSWYGADPLHLLVLLGCFALASYAGIRLFGAQPVEVAIWIVGAVIAHDLLLFPLYALADRSVRGVFSHRRAAAEPRVPWINYLRVPVVISVLLGLVYLPVILRLPAGFEGITTFTTDVYLARYLAIVGALFLASALAYALRLRRHARTARSRRPERTIRRGAVARKRAATPPPQPRSRM